jgi:hypothetical protein
MKVYTEHGTPCNQNENACAASNAHRLAQLLSRKIGISLSHALAAVTANSAAKEQHDG